MPTGFSSPFFAGKFAKPEAFPRSGEGGCARSKQTDEGAGKQHFTLISVHRRVFIFFSRVLWYTKVYFENSLPKEVLKMKAHIARNQNAGVPLALGWNLSPADRGKLEGMAPAFGMKLLLVAPADAGKTVAQLLGEVEVKAPRTLVLEPGAYPPALVLANFRDKDVDTLLDLMRQAQVTIPLKAVVTPANRNWMFADLLAHLQEEHTAFSAAKESQTV